MSIDLFPQYRKSHNEKSFYFIPSNDGLVELQIIGEKYILHRIEIRILPERNLVNDLLKNENEHWINIEGDEYERIFEHCKTNLTQVHQ